ncbi:MAG TPA: trypsin-like peptidase domain-containing protein [Vicinamibacterales bacterium]|jgi:serine protease Do
MLRRLFVPFVLLVAGFAAGMVLTARTESRASEAAPPPAAAQAAARPPAAVAPIPVSAVSAGMADFSKVAGQAVKGVANISSLQVVRTSNSPFGSDPFFRYFYDDDRAFGSRDRRSLSLGSGVMISPDGYVITNNHVVGDNVREITIALPDKREIRGKVIGTDPATDIALLKIDVKGVPVLPWGDSSGLKVGEWVLAIGSPFQLSQTVTAGIVSATGRTNVGFADYEDFIQTDAAINPGNSGGALVNSRGELVGINTGIFSESGGYQGIGFAVPSNLARRVVGDLMKFGEVRRGSVGYLRVDKLTDQLAEEVGSPTTNGAVVSRMMRGSETYDAGLRPGDVIVEFNRQPVDDPSQFFRLVADAKVGSTVSVRVLRDGRAMEFKLPIVSSSESSARVRR